jgi:hypothetical protein
MPCIETTPWLQSGAEQNIHSPPMMIRLPRKHLIIGTPLKVQFLPSETPHQFARSHAVRELTPVLKDLFKHQTRCGRLSRVIFLMKSVYQLQSLITR